MMNAQAAKFDRDKWRAQLGPVLDLWQQIVSSNSSLTSKRTREASVLNNRKVLDPVDDFVSMENELASDICSTVDISLTSLKKVCHSRISPQESKLIAYLTVRCYLDRVY